MPRNQLSLDFLCGSASKRNLSTTEPSLRPKILKEYVDLVFYKDLLDRYHVSNSRLMRLLLKHCLGQPASLEESYVVFLLSVAARSLRKQAMNPKKIHAIDWALGYPFVPKNRIDVGRKLESAVFLHWRRQREDLAYLGGNGEIDLVLNSDHPEVLINVAYSVTQTQTREREMAALKRAAANYPDATPVLVTHEPFQQAAGSDIRVVEAWRYLLEDTG